MGKSNAECTAKEQEGALTYGDAGLPLAYGVIGLGNPNRATVTHPNPHPNPSPNPNPGPNLILILTLTLILTLSLTLALTRPCLPKECEDIGLGAPPPGYG